MSLAFAAVLVLLSGCGGEDNKDGSRGDKDGPPIKVTAEQLSKDFVDDHKAATQKYGVKMLEVEGTVVGITPSEGVVNLEGTKRQDNFPMPVACQLRPAKSQQVVTLSKGQKVKVVGRISSTSTVTGVRLGDCDLTELTPSTLTTISAKDLTAAFKANKEDAEKKYKGKELIVEGKVADKKPPVNNVWILTLEAPGDLIVQCRMEGNADFEGVKKGDDVRIRCKFDFFSTGKFLILGDCYVLKAK
jgi:hypothetical protein